MLPVSLWRPQHPAYSHTTTPALAGPPTHCRCPGQASGPLVCPPCCSPSPPLSPAGWLAGWLAGGGGRMGVEGLVASVVASAAAAARLASSLGFQPQECLGPTLWLPGDGGASRGPQMLTSGLPAHLSLGSRAQGYCPCHPLCPCHLAGWGGYPRPLPVVPA